MPFRIASAPLLALLPMVAVGCHKLAPDQVAIRTVTLTGMAVAPVDQVADLVPASPAVLMARRSGQSDVPLAHARVQALDAALQPVPGVSEVRTDAGGRFTLDVPPGRAYVLRFSVGDEQRHVDLMTVARPGQGDGAPVVHADTASLVATKMILSRAGGLDQALAAVGAGELQVVVDLVRRGLAGKTPSLTSPQAVDELARQQQGEAGISGVLDRVDRAAAAAAAASAEAGPDRMVASAHEAPVAKAPDPSPSPSPSPSPTPAPADAGSVAAAYKADAQAPSQPAVEPPVRPLALTMRKRGFSDVDPYWEARAKAIVRVSLVAAPRPEGAGHVRKDAGQNRVTGSASGPRIASGPGTDRVESGSAVPGAAGGGGPARAGRADTDPIALVRRVPDSRSVVRMVRISRQAIARFSATGWHPDLSSSRGSHESAQPQAVAPRNQTSVLARFLGMLGRWWPGIQPPSASEFKISQVR